MSTTKQNTPVTKSIRRKPSTTTRKNSSTVHKSSSGTRRNSSAPRKRKKKDSNGLLRFLKSTPTWMLWTSGIVMVALYAFILYYIFVGPFSIRWRAQYGTVPEPVGYDIRGIDISHYQQNVNWAKLKEAELAGHPLRFVIIKATEGVTIRDVNFKSNIHKARRMNIIAGAYHFYIPGSDAAEQAHYFIKNVELGRGDLPPILDVEKVGNLSNEQLQQDVLTWLHIVEEHYGVKPIIYASYDFKRTHLRTPELDDYPLWVARYYKDELSYDGKWVMWQYTDLGEIDGIKGKVDCNVFNGTMHDLHMLCIKK